MANEFVARNGLISLGSVTLPYTAITSTYTVGENDYFINAVIGTFTINLPTAVGIQGKSYLIKNSGTGIITVDANSSETIDGVPTKELTSEESLQIISDGSNWFITNSATLGSINNYVTVGTSGSSDVDFYSDRKSVV